MSSETNDARGVMSVLQNQWAQDSAEARGPGRGSEPAQDRVAARAPLELDLKQSDFEMIRVYEDLIDLLVQKNLLILTEFPPAAQEKLLRRKRTRAMLSALCDIVDSEEEGIL